MDRMTHRPPRVLHVIEATEGGTRRWLEQAVLGLDPARVRCACICSLGREPSFRESIERFRARGIPVWVVPMERAIHPVRDAQAVASIADILRRERFDVVHGHSAKGGMLARLAARRVGFRPVVYSPHAFPFLCGGAKGRFYRQLERWALGFTDAIMAVSHAEAAAAVALGFDPARVFTAINGVQSSDPPLKWTSRADCIGTVSRLWSQKDPDTFLEACARVHREHPALRYVLCGSGPLEKRLRGKASALGLDASLDFVTGCEEPAPLVRSWRVFLSCSRYEGLSYALLDAMATGCPVVATRVPGTEEVVEHGRSGYLVPPGDADAMAAAVLSLLDDPLRAEAMGLAARERVLRHYQTERQLGQLAAFYESLAANPEGSTHESPLHHTRFGLHWRDARCRSASRT